MKPILCAVLAMLLLCGCAEQTEEIPPTTLLPAVVSTEPSGSYEPGSDLELATKGAVRVYPQKRDDIWAITAMGEDLLVFSGSETVTLTRLSGENLFCMAQRELNIFLSAEAPSLCIRDDALIYFDYLSRELVCLDGNLHEIWRQAVPQNLTGEPLLTQDGSKLFYCTPEGMYAMDMETGISRLVKQMWFADQFVEGLLMGDSVVRVAVMDAEGNGETLFLDAGTGAMVGGASHGFSLTSSENWFYATVSEGLILQMLFGNGETIYQLHPADYRDSGFFLPDSHSAVVSHWEEANLTLDYYDLESGKRTASLELDGIYPGSFVEDGRGMLYFLIFQEDGTQAICRWDVSASAVEDSTIYTGPWYTMDAPDETGMAECRDFADEIAREMGIRILIGTDVMAVRPWNYDVVPEYQVPIIRDAMAQLKEMLANYPWDFFQTALADLDEGEFTLCLVREICGSHASGNLEDVSGIQFWEDNHSYVVLAMGDDFRSSFYNEIYHVLEPRLLSRSIACYRWDEWNPKGFDYDYDYITNRSRNGSEYLENSNRSFIDTFSMSFPKEDRARVMEYACMPGNEAYFISETMQKKLRALCQGIREAYGLEDYPQALLWEQYLESPIDP